MFLAAFTSRSCTMPHAAHVQMRTLSGLGPSLVPQAEHTWLVGSNRPARANVRPYLAALYSSMCTNADQPASCTDLASRVRPSPATHKSSTYTAWLSRMIRVMGGAICLMLAGALFVAVFFALLTNVIVGRRIEESLGRQRLTALSGHVLVIGLGSVGLRVVEQLAAAGSEIVVVEKNEHNRHLGQARALGVPVVIADATLPQVLESVRLAGASAVAVLTSDDLANLETGLAVRDQLGPRWGTTPVVLRIFDSHLARSVKTSFGFTFVRSTAALAAPWFVGAALGLDVLNTFYVGDELLLVARLTITPRGGLHGLQMYDLAARTRVLAIRRAADKTMLEHLPRRTTRFQPDDEAYLIGPYEELLTVLRRDRPTPQAVGPQPASPGESSRPPGSRLTH